MIPGESPCGSEEGPWSGFRVWVDALRGDHAQESAAPHFHADFASAGTRLRALARTSRYRECPTRPLLITAVTEVSLSKLTTAFWLRWGGRSRYPAGQELAEAWPGLAVVPLPLGVLALALGGWGLASAVPVVGGAVVGVAGGDGGRSRAKVPVGISTVREHWWS